MMFVSSHDIPQNEWSIVPLVKGFAGNHLDAPSLKARRVNPEGDTLLLQAELMAAPKCLFAISSICGSVKAERSTVSIATIR